MPLAFLRGLFASRASLVAENLAFRQQLLVLQRSVKRPKLRKCDRVFWSWLSRLWTNWPFALALSTYFRRAQTALLGQERPRQRPAGLAITFFRFFGRFQRIPRRTAREKV